MPRFITRVRVGVIAGTVALLVAPLAGPARADLAAPSADHAQGRAAPPSVTQVRLSPETAQAGTPVSAQLTVRSSACFTAAVLGVGVRDAAGDNLDFPGELTNQAICPQDLSLTTGTRAFPAGTYRVFGFYQDQAGRWHNLPEKTLTVTAATGSTPFPGATSLIWSEEFNGPLSADRWNRSTSSSYRYGSYNPDDDKPDRIDRRRSRSPTARPRSPPHPARSGSRAIGTPGTPVC